MTIYSGNMLEIINHFTTNVIGVRQNSLIVSKPLKLEAKLSKMLRFLRVQTVQKSTMRINKANMNNK